MRPAEAIELLEDHTGLTFTLNEFNGQVESKIGDWRISISRFTNELATNPSKIKILCATLVYTSCETGRKVIWKTGQQFATYSMRTGLLLICGWLTDFQSAMGFKTDSTGGSHNG